MNAIRRYEIALLGILLITCWVIAWKFEVDIKTLFHVAQLAAEGRTAEIYLAEPGIGRFFYGPLTAVFLAPLGFFSFATAKLLWVGVQTLSFVLVFWALYYLFPVFRSSRRWPFFLMLSFAINPVHNNFQSNNIQLFLLAVLAVSEIASRSSKRSWRIGAGVAVAFAAAVKVFPGFIAAYYLFRRSRETRWGIGWGVLLALALPFACFGISGGRELYEGFLSNLRTYDADNSLTRVPDILCLPSLLARWGLSDSASKAISLGFALVFLGWAVGKENGRTLEFWSLSLLVMALANPSTRVHYFVFYLPAFCVLLQSYFQGFPSKETLAYIVGSLLLLAFTVEGVVGKSLNNQMEFLSLPTWGAILLGIGVVRGCLRATNPAV